MAAGAGSGAGSGAPCDPFEATGWKRSGFTCDGERGGGSFGGGVGNSSYESGCLCGIGGVSSS